MDTTKTYLFSNENLAIIRLTCLTNNQFLTRSLAKLNDVNVKSKQYLLTI